MNAAKETQDRAERAYDSAIIELRKLHAELGCKIQMRSQLPPGNFAEWHKQTKSRAKAIENEIPSLKAQRAEARRAFNSWAPAAKEDWLEEPDCPGWWWAWDANVSGSNRMVGCFEVYEDADGGLVCDQAPHFDEGRYSYRYQPEPDAPK